MCIIHNWCFIFFFLMNSTSLAASTTNYRIDEVYSEAQKLICELKDAEALMILKEEISLNNEKNIAQNIDSVRKKLLYAYANIIISGRNSKLTNLAICNMVEELRQHNEALGIK